MTIAGLRLRPCVKNNGGLLIRSLQSSLHATSNGSDKVVQGSRNKDMALHFNVTPVVVAEFLCVAIIGDTGQPTKLPAATGIDFITRPAGKDKSAVRHHLILAVLFSYGRLRHLDYIIHI